jgi:sporulation protein YlmC with PRC-barrel domain
MRAADLQGKRVVDEAGKRLGHVDEIHVENGQVTALAVGRGGLLQRFTSSHRGHRVAWADVRKITPQEIVVARARAAPASAARSPRRGPGRA